MCEFRFFPQNHNLDIRVKCTTCLLSLGLATGAASSACRFLQKDWAPVKTGLLLMAFLTMADTQMHTPTHTTQTQRHKLRNVLESSALLNYYLLLLLLLLLCLCSIMSLIYLYRNDRIRESNSQILACWKSFYLYHLKSVDLKFLKGCIPYIFSFHML